MLGVAPGAGTIKPVTVALVSTVAFEPANAKSSADSISDLPPTSGRVAVAILPSGSPVLKKKDDDVAAAGSGVKRPIESAEIASPGIYNRMTPSIGVGRCLRSHGESPANVHTLQP